jgi:hypothetical protein
VIVCAANSKARMPATSRVLIAPPYCKDDSACLNVDTIFAPGRTICETRRSRRSSSRCSLAVTVSTRLDGNSSRRIKA